MGGDPREIMRLIVYGRCKVVGSSNVHFIPNMDPVGLLVFLVDKLCFQRIKTCNIHTISTVGNVKLRRLYDPIILCLSNIISIVKNLEAMRIIHSCQHGLTKMRDVFLRRRN